MLRPYRFGVPALLVVGLYLVAVVVAVVVAWTAGDLGVLWRLTVFVEVEEVTVVTWPNVISLVLAGAVWAWALWQGLRGPLAGPSPTLDRDERRLRLALYATAVTWPLYFLAPSWAWWMAVLDSVVMVAVVWSFRPVVTRNFKAVDYLWTLGVMGYGGAIVAETLDFFGPGAPREIETIYGLTALVWTVLVLRAQRMDGRWRLTTVLYGVAALLLPALMPLSRLFTDGEAVYGVLAAAEAVNMVWLIRSAHDLADPRPTADLVNPLTVSEESA